ncbi:cation transporter [Candidatus Acetothermia bacterium]|nr:cation transporter [Candidatus Acetothermia bacterium]
MGIGLKISWGKRAIWLSIGASIVTLILKFGAYFLTGSVGLLSDAAESLINFATAVIALVALTVASRPADADHAYGHEKAEYFSSGVEGTLILVAAVGIVWTAFERFLHPADLKNLNFGIGIALLASAINWGVARILLKAARDHDSITLEADAKHLLTDVWTSVSVVLALVIVNFTNWTILDPLAAIAIALNIVWAGVDLLKRSMQGLMDYTLPAEELAKIETILHEHQEEFSSYHALRTRKSGSQRFIDLHLLVPGEISVKVAHDLCETIEAEMRAVLGHASITVHVEPAEDAAAWETMENSR